MKDSKNKRTIILSVILLGLVVVAYRVIFAPPAVDSSLEGGIYSSAAVESILNQVENINFDTAAVKDPKVGSLKSIEAPLPSLPVGKKNPFSGF